MDAFRDELAKIAEALTVKDKALRILPAVGATAGGIIGAAKTKNKRAVRGLLGAGTGATVGWLPQVFDEAAKASRAKTKLGGLQPSRVRMTTGAGAAMLKPRKSTQSLFASTNKADRTPGWDTPKERYNRLKRAGMTKGLLK